MRPFLAIVFLVLHVGAANADDLTALVDTLSEGVWGWPEGENTCPLNPQRLEFSTDNETVTFRWDHTHDPAVYRILYHDSSSITMLLVGEDRLTDSGDSVVWQLLVKGEDRFCWRRTDWPSYACTPDLQKCESEYL